jgi:iron complex outermembrane recepter protein
MTPKNRIMWLGTSVLAMAVSGSALAQTAPASSTPSTTATTEPATPAAGEIVVTATKREQSLNKVGMSISALSADQLAARHVVSVSDLAQVTPGLTFAPTPTSTPVYTLRGVGFFDSTLAAYPDVSVYIDQVPLSLPVMSTLTAFDLERVEVLKGPQGTLFGNNATGGAINMVAAKPTNITTGALELGYGRFDTIEASGFLSGPLTDTLKGRVAFRVEDSGDGWQHSYTSNATTGKLNNMAGRILLDWNPTSRLKISLNVNGWVNKDDPQAPQKIGNTPQNPVPSTFLVTNYPNAPQSDTAAGWGPNQPYADTAFWQTALRVDYDLDFATLTSLSSYSSTRFLNATEGDGTPYADLDIAQDYGVIHSVTQELRLANGAGHRLRWVIGGNLENTNVKENTVVQYPYSSSALVNGITANTYYSDQEMRNYAAFANGEFDLTNQLTLKGGIRYTRAERNLYEINHDDPDFPPPENPFTGEPGTTVTNFFNAVYGAVYGGAVPTIAPGGNIVLDTRTNANGTPVNPATYLTTAPVVEQLRENSVSWSAGLDWKPVDNILLYANVSRGYKAGSFPHLSGSIYTAYQPVKEEELTDYEAGFKWHSPDRKLSINGAAFYYDYRNKQLRAKFVDPIFGALDLLVNVPKSYLIGAETSIEARPTRELSISAAGTYLYSRVSNYDGVIGEQSVGGLLQGVVSSFHGVPLPFAPKWQYSIRADYDRPVSEKINGFIGIGLHGQSESESSLVLPGSAPFGTPSSFYTINAYALVDGNIGIHSANNTWRLTIWAKNLFNKYYWTNAIQSYDTFVRYAGRPAEYGATLRYKF